MKWLNHRHSPITYWEPGIPGMDVVCACDSKILSLEKIRKIYSIPSKFPKRACIPSPAHQPEAFWRVEKITSAAVLFVIPGFLKLCAVVVSVQRSSESSSPNVTKNHCPHIYVIKTIPSNTTALFKPDQTDPQASCPSKLKQQVWWRIS